MINPELEQFLRLTAFLGQVLGPDYEVALHDLTDPDHSLIAVANGHISQRKLGSRLPSAARGLLDELRNKTDSKDYQVNYRTVTGAGKSLRSSALVIRSEGRLAGMLCINFDDGKYQDLSQGILKLCHPDAFVDVNFQVDEARLRELDDGSVEPETAAQALTQSAERDIERALAATRGRGLSVAERLALVSDLDMDGAFLIKGAMKRIASLLNVSQATLYRDLQRARQGMGGK